MKSKEFMTEGMAPSKRMTEKWAGLIKRDCQPFLDAIKHKPLIKFPLYRGINKAMGEYFIKSNVRLDNRKPMDISPEMHNKINEYFIKEYGDPFRNAIFCTGNQHNAQQYGDPYYIFPIGDFKFIWSFKIHDLYPQLKREINNQEVFSDKELINFLDFANYQPDRLTAAADSGHEIMIRCKEYYAINVNSIKGIESYLETLLQ